MWASALADILLAIHFAWVFFILVGVVLVFVGWFRKWQWIHNSWFRNIHVLMIGFVVMESAIGMDCPLTTWEYQLREQDGIKIEHRGCIQQWMRKLLFVDATQEVLNISYFAFGAAVVILYFAVPPRWPLGSIIRPTSLQSTHK